METNWAITSYMELPRPINRHSKTSYLSETTPTYENSFRTGTSVNVEEKLGDEIDEQYLHGEGSETSTENSIKSDTTIKADEFIDDLIDGYLDAKGRENSRENSVKTDTTLFAEEKENDGTDEYSDGEGSETSTENSKKTGTITKESERIGDVIDGYQDTKGRKSSFENAVKTETALFVEETESDGIDAKGSENINKETIKKKLLTHRVRTNTRLIQKGMNSGKGIPYTEYLKHKYLTDIGPDLSAKQRAQIVQKRCKTFMKENNIQFDHFKRNKYDKDAHMISQRYNLSLCYNCKVASTNTKRIIYALDNEFAGDINTIKKSAARAYSITRKKPFNEMLSGVYNTVSVMFVREPIERLLSAYRDRRSYPEFFKSGSFTFKDYLKRVLDDKVENLNRHVYPYFDKCRPCEIQYDFVVLQKNFNEDMDVILKQINAYGKIGIPERNKTGYSTSDSEKLVKKYFKKVPNEMIHQLWEKYYKDYYIFGFPYPSHLINNS